MRAMISAIVAATPSETPTIAANRANPKFSTNLYNSFTRLAQPIPNSKAAPIDGAMEKLQLGKFCPVRRKESVSISTARQKKTRNFRYGLSKIEIKLRRG